MTRNEIRMSKERRIQRILVVILCILTIAVIAVYISQKDHEETRDEYHVLSEEMENAA